MGRQKMPRTIRAIEVLLRPPLAAITKKDYQGLENLPKEGGFVLAANHNSHVDPFLLARFALDVGLVPRYLAKEGLFTHKLTGPILRGADQIPVAPESGLTIRKRPPSTGPVAADQISMMSPSAVVMRTRPASAAPAPAPIASAPAPIANAPAPEPATLNYAVATATLTRMGISAQREDGTHKQVAWDSVIGVIARRLPTEAPYDGSTFVDVVSAAGATLRFLPWTQIDGAPILGEGEERARAFVQLVAARCLDAKLDSYTKVFADGGGRAAQLPSAKTLAAHDEKLG